MSVVLKTFGALFLFMAVAAAHSSYQFAACEGEDVCANALTAIEIKGDARNTTACCFTGFMNIKDNHDLVKATCTEDQSAFCGVKTYAALHAPTPRLFNFPYPACEGEVACRDCHDIKIDYNNEIYCCYVGAMSIGSRTCSVDQTPYCEH